MRTRFEIIWMILVIALAVSIELTAQESSTNPSSKQVPQRVQVDWNKVLKISRADATLQVVITALMARDSQVHDQVWGALTDLHARYTRFVPCLPYLESKVRVLIM